MKFEASDRIKFATGVLAAAILSSGLTLGLYQVGSGLAARAGNSITVTGTASENATADNAVWSLNLNESQPTLAASVKKIDASADGLKKYLLDGGISTDQIELGPINSNAVPEYINGNPTGRILAYQAYRTVTVRTKDVALVARLSNNIGTLLATGINVGNYGPSYYLSTLDDMRPKLLAAAMQDAKARAEAITESVGGKVGALISVSTGPTQVTTKNSLERAAGGVYDLSTIEKTVNVTLSASFKTK
ncbi:MAG: SIMPL domain-containing protein [Candidatus Nanopelagicus sp.]